jgi:signal transduction histidine kinase
MTAYPERVPQQAYAWARSHQTVVDGLLGLALLACSAGQLRLSPASTAFAAATVSALLALAVVLRRQATVAAFGVAAILGLGQATLGFRPSGGATVRALQPTMTDAAIVVLLYTLAGRRPRRESLTGLALCLAGSGIAIYGWTYAHSSAALLLLAAAALGATFIAAWVTGDSAAYRRAHYASLQERLTSAERTADLQRTRAHAVEESAARLRRIERDLHDGAQVRLTALAMTLGEIKETLVAGPSGPGETLALARQAHQMAKDTLAELRDLARGIHPLALDRGLDAALHGLTESSAMPVSLDIVIAARPSPAIEAIVYFSAAELLANATKHAGASRVTITVRATGAGGVRLTVTDDGAGGARVTDGGGLAGLRERVGTVDGRIGIDSPAAGPTTVTIDLPGHA